jgi:hypothetical protein
MQTLWEAIKLFIMIVEPPKTVLDFKRVEKSILELMANPYCDEFMFRSLSDKLDKCQATIKELEQLRNVNPAKIRV